MAGEVTVPVDQAAWDRVCRPKTCRLVQNRALACIVAEKLQLSGLRSRLPGGSSVGIQTT